MNEDEILDELVAQAKDLDGWVEVEAITSNKGAVCPHCERLVSTQFCGRDGVGRCQHCGKAFGWRADGSPIGFAFTTWKFTDPKKGESK